MPKTLEYKNTDKYYWCAWGGDVCHFGKLEADQQVSTSQPNFESYDTEAELSIKVDSLKGDNHYYLFITDYPKSDDSKSEIQAWLTMRGISFESSATKEELLELT